MLLQPEPSLSFHKECSMVKFKYELLRVHGKDVLVISLAGRVPSGSQGNTEVVQILHKINAIISDNSAVPSLVVFDFRALIYEAGDSVGTLWMPLLAKRISVAGITSVLNRDAFAGLNTCMGPMSIPFFDDIGDAMRLLNGSGELQEK